MYKYKALKVNGKRIDEHRYVMQQHLGRKLLRNEVVRHKDKNTLNNSLDNLYLITRQEQFKEQLAAGELPESMLTGIKNKAAGIKKKRAKQIKKYIPKPPKEKKQKQVFIEPPKKTKVFETRKIDSSKLVSIKIDKRTTISVKEGTSQEEIDRIIKKYKRTSLI